MSIVLKNNGLSNLSNTLFYNILDAEDITGIFNKLLNLQIALSYQMQLEITTDTSLSSTSNWLAPVASTMLAWAFFVIAFLIFSAAAVAICCFINELVHHLPICFLRIFLPQPLYLSS